MVPQTFAVLAHYLKSFSSECSGILSFSQVLAYFYKCSVSLAAANISSLSQNRQACDLKTQFHLFNNAGMSSKPSNGKL